MKIGNILLAFICLACISCHTKPISQQLIVLVDRSDTMRAVPSQESICTFLNLDSEIPSDVICKLSIINAVSLNSSSTIQMRSENEWLGNEFDSKANVRAFKDSLNAVLNRILNTKTESKYSSIYLRIARELDILSRSDAEVRTFLVYGDFMENTTKVSFYNSGTLTRIINDPSSVALALNEQAVLPDLTGITIYIIYQPSSIEEDESFQIVSTFYKRLFESNGAQVYITSQL